MKLLSLLATVLLYSAITQGQSSFTESSYSLQTQLPDSAGLYIKTFKNNLDPSYTMKKVYLDSSYTTLLSKAFYKSDVAEGPMNIYTKGQPSLTGTYKNGKWHGERLTYRNNTIVQKAFFNEGTKTGIWEEYNTQGQLKRRISYDAAGKVISDVTY